MSIVAMQSPKSGYKSFNEEKKRVSTHHKRKINPSTVGIRERTNEKINLPMRITICGANIPTYLRDYKRFDEKYFQKKRVEIGKVPECSHVICAAYYGFPFFYYVPNPDAMESSLEILRIHANNFIQQTIVRTEQMKKRDNEETNQFACVKNLERVLVSPTSLSSQTTGQ